MARSYPAPWFSVGLAVCGALLVATPRPMSAGNPPSAGEVHEQHVPPIAFHPANSSVGYVVEEGGLGRLCSTRGAGYFVAQLHLRDGAMIERITVYLEDTNHDGLGMMSLVRRGPRAFEVLAMTPISIETGDIEALATTEISAPVVDNKEGAYLLQAVLTGPGVCLHDAQVTYRLP